ncbi:hypothetical protein LBHB_04295 [Leptospira borgpetersenii serovar Hardjo]|nr:hypothetical protein LBHB_04295 [Leptospira borgpetersenii serovar Hardjo]
MEFFNNSIQDFINIQRKNGFDSLPVSDLFIHKSTFIFDIFRKIADNYVRFLRTSLQRVPKTQFTLVRKIKLQGSVPVLGQNLIFVMTIMIK